MKNIRAFVGHSFDESDAKVVSDILKFLTTLTDLRPGFSWAHAERAEARGIDQKVLATFEEKNVFIGICTRRERAIDPKLLTSTTTFLRPTCLRGSPESFEWKTSDWIIQEIGLAIGRGLKTILLVEDGVRSPGGLQGNVEYIPFDRRYPEKAFSKLSEMIVSLSPVGGSQQLDESAPLLEAPEESPTGDSAFGEDWATPNATWKQEDYEFRFMHFIFMDDMPTAARIGEQFLASGFGIEPSATVTWNGFQEYVKVAFGKGGSLSDLVQLVEDNPTISKLRVHLGRAYERYDEYAKAAEAFEAAADMADDNALQLELLGRAAGARQKAGTGPAALRLLERMKDAHSGSSEVKILDAERKVAALRKDHDIEIAAMERLLDIDPSSTNTRFALAFKYSEQGRRRLSAFHYLKIPPSERTGAAWNNVGVELGYLDLVSASVDAYRKAEALGETLAMSNLASKLIGAGFLAEAKALCDVASSMPDYHQNIDSARVRIKEIPEKEAAKEEEIVASARLASQFYQNLGAAVTRPTVAAIASVWHGPRCDLTIAISGLEFTATGSYTEPKSLLASAFGLGKLAGFDDAPEKRVNIEYRGELRGRCILATVSRTREGEPTKAKSVLGSDADSTKVLMYLGAGGKLIHVLEVADGDKPKFYELTC